MTLGQKMKLLLKENHMTQEDLAEKLEVSRQAVGKWVNDKGIPEVGKLVQISNLFGVSTDYLLKENYPLKEENNENKPATDNGYYVSGEMLNGYLLYSRQNTNRITCGISLFIIANVFDSFGYYSKVTTILYWLTLIAGVILIIWQFFQPRQYQEIKTEHLLFDDKIYEVFRKQRETRRKKYAVMIIAGVIILFASSETDSLLIQYFGYTVCNICGWLLDAAWLALFIWAGMSMHADSIIIKNTEQIPKNNPLKRYRWVYVALPVTAIAVLIGFLTNVWHPIAPIIVLFCALLVTTCKLILETMGKGESNEIH